jgi:PleD family two-component response regulator
LKLVAAAEVAVEGTDKVVKLTVSAGVAELDCENHIISVQRADKALYEAKYDGKNCVRLWRPECAKASLPVLKTDAASSM